MKYKSQTPSLLDKVPRNLQPLRRAYLLTKIASRVGFDWPNLDGVLKKLREELNEFQHALCSKDSKKVREEIGDLLFILINLSRILKIDPEEALQMTIKKFILRFQYIERRLRQKGKSLRQSSLMEMDALWEEAKVKEKKGNKKRRAK
ncbi:MAG: MazG nucleotide pyrophosphohydrolase domain-containing protein [Thermodesulfobacteriota bacterium]